MIARLVDQSNSKPSTLHCLVTTLCGLKCDGCFYVKGEPDQWTWMYAQSIVEQAGKLGVKWLAIGGGEPTLWLFLNDMCVLAKERYGMHTAVTTNGMQQRPIYADKVHISYDERHWSKWPLADRNNRIGAIRGMIKYYREMGCRVGINTVLDDVPQVETEVLQSVESITFMLDKPYAKDVHESRGILLEREIARCSKHTLVSVDSCLSHLHRSCCAQGRISMAIDQHGKFSACSNSDHRFEASSLAVGWDLVRCRDEQLPKGCILKNVMEPDGR